jgi:hypothetical protein
MNKYVKKILIAVIIIVGSGLVLFILSLIYSFASLYFGLPMIELPTGEIYVDFKVGTREQEARDLFIKYNLKAPDNLFKSELATLNSTNDSYTNLLAYSKALKMNPLIKSLEVIDSRISSSRFMSVPRIDLRFTRPLSQDEVDSIVLDYPELAVIRESTDPIWLMTVKVPLWQEQSYAEKLLKEPIVESTQRKTSYLIDVYGLPW